MEKNQKNFQGLDSFSAGPNAVRPRFQRSGDLRKKALWRVIAGKAKDWWGAAWVLCLIVYSTWARGGTWAPAQWPLLWLGAAGLAGLFLAGGARSFFRDPVTYFGAAFLALLILQAWNTGRELVLDPAQFKWIYSPPPHAGWPSSFNRAEALEMLRWFFPACVLLAVLRSGLPGHRAGRLILRGLVYNAGLLALLGLAQFADGTKSIFWIQPMEDHFFASFGYANHAGAFFVLVLAVAVGLVLEQWKQGRIRSHPVRFVLLIVCAGLCLAGATLSLSRASMLLSWGVAALGAGYFFVLCWGRAALAGRVNLILGLLAGLLAVVFVAAGPGRDVILREFRPAEERYPDVPVVTRAESMELLIPAAVRIWRQHPWVGVGGWGFRYLLGLNVPEERWAKIVKGSANVHNDPLQFLVEFGLVGAGLLAALLAVLLFRAVRCASWTSPLFLFGMGGVGLIGLYSLMDIPFRSPAILYTWLTMASFPPMVAGRVACGAIKKEQPYE